MICGSDGRSFDMELSCVDACIICDIDGFTGRNNNGGRPDEGDRPPTFCTSINHNIQWIGFLAGSEELTIELAVTDCEKGLTFDGGLEAGVYEVVDCDVDGATAVSNCNSAILQDNVAVLEMDALVPGRFYYLVIDGNNADICDYTVGVTRGTTKVPDVTDGAGVNGPTRLCTPGPARYTANEVRGATAYAWTVDGTPAGVPDRLEQTFDFPAAGTYEVCVQGSNICDSGAPACRTVRVGPVPPTRVALPPTCDGAPVTSPSGTVYASTGDYTETLVGEAGCDSLVTYEVLVREAIATETEETICEGATYAFDGRQLDVAGTYTATLRSTAGCDSAVTLDLVVEPCSFESFSATTAATCAGRADGAVEAWVLGPPDDYRLRYRREGDAAFAERALSADGTRVRIEGLAAGRYELVFRSGRNGDRTAVETVGEPEPLSLADGGIDGPARLCAAGEATFVTGAVAGATAYAWTLDGAPVGGSDRRQSIRLPADGRYEVCARATTDCATGPPQCRTVRVGLPPPTRVPLPPVCDGDAATSPSGARYTATGDYPETLVGAGGCDSVVVYGVTVRDPIGTSTARTLCLGETLSFDGRQIGSAGTYVATLTAADGCDSTVTLTLQTRACAYVPAFEVSPVRCAAGADGAISTQVQGPPAEYTLLHRAVGAASFSQQTIEADGTPVTIGDLRAGDYELIWRSSLGGEQQAIATVPEPAPVRLAVEPTRHGDYDVSCAGGRDGELSAAAAGGTPPYRYTWTGDREGPRLTGLPAGDYALSVRDAAECPADTTVTLAAPPPLRFAVRGLPEGCDPAVAPGRAELTELGGGQSPYEVRVLGEARAYAPADDIALAPGAYVLRAEDRFGCAVEREVDIGQAARASVYASADTLVVRPRTAVVLRPRYEGPVDRYAWYGDGPLDCTDCPFPTTQPVAEASYEIAIATVDDCRDTARLVLTLGTDFGLYAPTAFSPDGDGVNDGFTVFAAEEGAVVESLEVFTRWGERIFTAEEFRPNDPMLGWDGRIRGQDANAAVFAYVARVRFFRGEVRSLTGEVVLMR